MCRRQRDARGHQGHARRVRGSVPPRSSTYSIDNDFAGDRAIGFLSASRSRRDHRTRALGRRVHAQARLHPRDDGEPQRTTRPSLRGRGARTSHRLCRSFGSPTRSSRRSPRLWPVWTTRSSSWPKATKPTDAGPHGCRIGEPASPGAARSGGPARRTSQAGDCGALQPIPAGPPALVHRRVVGLPGRFR